MKSRSKDLQKTSFSLIQYPINVDTKKTIRQVFTILKKIPLTDYIILPEMWLGGPRSPMEHSLWNEIYQEALRQIQHWCRAKKTNVILSQLEIVQKNTYNTSFWIDKSGRIFHRYRKIHLFTLGGEGEIFSSGEKISTVKTLHGLMGSIVCYDLRFPELIRCMANQGIKVLIVSAQWPESRRDHWLTLLKARAIENQIYVVAANRLGEKDGQKYSGDSVIIDPWGKILLHLGPHKKWGTCSIDGKDLDKIRTQYPFFEERKFFGKNLPKRQR